MLVGAHQDPVQRAVVLGVAVVSAGLDGAFNALVCMAVHSVFPPLKLGTDIVLPQKEKEIREFLPRLLFDDVCGIVLNRLLCGKLLISLAAWLSLWESWHRFSGD